MIDVTGDVPSRRAIDSPLLVDLELIFGAACLTPIGFLGGNAPAAIGRDIDPSLDWLCRKQTEPRTERPIRKKPEDIVRGIVANFYDVSSNRNGVRVVFTRDGLIGRAALCPRAPVKPLGRACSLGYESLFKLL